MESKSHSSFKYDSLLSQYISIFQCPAGSFLILCWTRLARRQLWLRFLSTWIPSLHPFSGSFTAPWRSMLRSSEQYCLAWESKYLMELGNALDSLLNGVVNMMAQEALKFTVLSGKNPNRIRPAWVALVQFHCWCLFRGAFLNKEDFWEGISLGRIGITLQKWPENLLCHTCNLDLLSWIAVPLCHWLILLKLQLETPSFTRDCVYFPMLLQCVLLLYMNLSNRQVTFMHSVCLPPYQNIRFFLIFSLAKHFSDRLLRKKNWKWQKVLGLAFNFSEPSCFWYFLRAAQICDYATLFALCVAGIVTALTWPASLLTVASVIDNPWGVCLHRSAEVGKHLAHILLSRQQVAG